MYLETPDDDDDDDDDGSRYIFSRSLAKTLLPRLIAGSTKGVYT
jgi:hypothetical protein